MEKFALRREIPVDDGYDIVIAGGGPAGCAAAVCAARLGARVMIAESLGCLGGAGTSGLVIEWGNLGRYGTLLVGGFMREIFDEMLIRGFLIQWCKEKTEIDMFAGIPFDAEGLKLVLDDFMEKEKVEVRFFTQVIGVDKDEASLHVNGVVVSNIEGLRFIKAKTFIDCTGDAVLAKMCGVPCEEPATVMPPNLMAICSGADFEKMNLNYNGGQIEDQQKYLEKALEDNFFSQPDRHLAGLFKSVGDSVSMNCGHIFGMNPLNCRSLSDSMVKGRRLVQEYLRFFREYCPGCKDLYLVTTATLLGIRDSRRIKGEYWLNYEDYVHRRKFPDQIALNAQNIDIHPLDASAKEYERFHNQFFETNHYGPGEYFGIPYGVLVPKGSQNLWVAGRSVSCDTQMHGSIRQQLCAYMFGQAAGVAAVQSIQTGQKANELNTASLVKTLRLQGAILPQDELSETMTRN